MTYSDKKIAQVIAPYKYYIIKIFKFGCGSLAVYTGTILLFYFVVFMDNEIQKLLTSQLSELYIFWL